MEQTERKKAPTFASLYGKQRSNSASSFCRITGKSRSMDEHHYVFSSDDYPKFENLSGCRITEKHHHFKDYKYLYPILDVDGVTRMVTEHDFHCRITSKYRAMAGHRYVYPLLGTTSNQTVDEMVSVVDEDSMKDVFLPSEVEDIIRGGVRDVLKLKDGEHIFIQSKEGSLFPAATKELFKRKETQAAPKRQRRHTLPVSLEASIAKEVAEVCAPKIKLLKEIKAPPPPPLPQMLNGQDEKSLLEIIPKNVQILQDVRKSRPKRPGRRSKNKENEVPNRKEETRNEEAKSNGIAEDQFETSTEETPKRLSRLEKYKLQFQSFDEKYNNKTTGNQLVLVGSFNEDEVEELDFSEPSEIRYIESQVSIKQHAIISNEICVEKHSTDSHGIVNKTNTDVISLANIADVEAVSSEIKQSVNDESTMPSVADEINKESSPPKSFQELKSLIGSKLDLKKALKIQSGSSLLHSKSAPCDKEDGGNEDIDEDEKSSVDHSKFVQQNKTRTKKEKEYFLESNQSSGDILKIKIEEKGFETGFSDEKMLKDQLEVGLKKSTFLENLGSSENQEDISICKNKSGKRLSSWESIGSLNVTEKLSSILDETDNLSEDLLLKNVNEKIDASKFVLADMKTLSSNTKATAEENTSNDSSMIFEDNQNIANEEQLTETSSIVSSNQFKLTSKEVSTTSKGFSSPKNEFVVGGKKEDGVGCAEMLHELGLMGNTSPYEYLTESNTNLLKDSAVGSRESGVTENFSQEKIKNQSANTDSGSLDNNSMTSVSKDAGGSEVSASEMSHSKKALAERDHPKLKDSSFKFSSSTQIKECTISNDDSSKTESTLSKLDENLSGRGIAGEETRVSLSHPQSLPNNFNPETEGTKMSSNNNLDVISNGVLESVGDATRQVGKGDDFANKIQCQGVIPTPPESHLLSGATEGVSDLDDSIEVRLPVTCSLLKRDKWFMPESESDGVRTSGKSTSTSLRAGTATKKHAKGNNICLQGPDVYVSIMDFKPMGSDEEAVAMREGQSVEIIDASKPRRWLVRVLPMCPGDSPQEGWVPACYLERSTPYDEGPIICEAEFDPREIEAIQNREAIVKELVETEEDFAKDMQFVVENYYKRMESSDVPKEFRDRKGSVFGNFKDISDFHNNVLMEGIHYHAKQPTKLGKTFLRLERDFDMHAHYCWNEARAQQILREGALREYFDAHSRSIEDDKLLSDHLKLPIQRLNDYQLLLKELIKYSSRLGEDTADLQKALDFIHGINGRTRDLQYVLAMQGCRGDLLKIGKILKHEVFDVLEADGDQIYCERHVFLFKGRLFVTEKRALQGKETYHVTNLFKLQDVEMVENVDAKPLAIVFRSHKKSRPGFPITFVARSQDQKQEWCREIASANQVVEDLGELEPCIDLKDVEHPELKHKAEEPEEVESKKPKVESLKRQKSGDSAPQTPTEDITKPPLSRQESAKKKSKSGESSAPQTPTESNNKPPKLSREDSVRKKQSKSSESPTEEIAQPALKRQDSTKKKTSAPQTPTKEVETSPLTRQDSKGRKSSTGVTPVEETAPPSLSRQDSDKKSSVPQTPVEETAPPSLSRQDSDKKSSVPQTPVEETAPPSLSRQDSTKKSSVPQTPVEETAPPSLSRQDSDKKSSVPQTPVEETAPPALSRQQSTKKSSVPQTPVQETAPPSLSRQDSTRKSSVPQTPVEETAPPALSRQDSTKKSSVPQTPTDEVQASPLTRKDSKKKPSAPETPTEEARAPPLSKIDSEKKSSIPETPTEETQVQQLSRQESKKKVEEKVKRQDSADKKESPKDKPSDKKKGEDSIPKIIMSEDASGSDARMESVDLNEDNATLASESLQSDESVTPPPSEVDPMDKPRFSKTLRGVTCALGEKAVLECETEGSPVPSVTWLKDNQKLSKSNKRAKTASKGQKHTLTLDEVTSDDGGLYTAIAGSAKGTASCSAPLNLKIPLLGVPKDDSRPTTPGGTVLPHAPVFKVKLNKETQLLEGTSVRFELVVRGNPEPKVKFFKDGKELKVDDRVRVSYESKEVFELILDHVVAKDAGKYSCVATNTEGEDKTVGTLSVVKNKDVFKGLEDTLEEERTPTPRPRTPKFKWFKDGQQFEANERFQVIFNEEEDSLALMFQHVTPDDAGLYTCVASTSTGSKIACSAELTVQGVIRQVEAPGIKAQLSDVEATEGGSAMLELKITGFPKPKVTWFHKNKEISTGGRFRFLFADDETFTLVIKNVVKDDGGKYVVKAVNEMGEAESSCTMTVKSAPCFVKGLKDMAVMTEETIVFEAQIDGNPAPEVKWYKDGQQLNASDRLKITNEGGKLSLKILKAKPTDSGSYSCVLTNSIGSQAEFSNVVVKASPTFSKGMENVEGLEGDKLQFSVEVNGNPKPTLKWTKDGKELTVDGKHIKLVEDAPNSYTLVIDKAKLSDVGVYTCEIRNDHGLKASSGNLNLKTKPEFIKKLCDSECKEGEGISLSTMVKGYPCPTIKWFLGETELAEDKNYSIISEKGTGNYSLKIKKASRNMSGTYTCKAINEMGETSSSGILNVIVTKKKPEIDQELKPTQLVEGKPGKLTAKVLGEPKPKIQWLKDGKLLPRDGRFSVEESDDGTIVLLIDKVNADDAGLYSILAISEEGEAKSEAPVTTIPAGKKPEFVKELEKQDLIEGQPLKLLGKVTGSPTSIKWQKDGEDISADDRIKLSEESDGTIALLIDNVNQKDAGKYTVIASNSEGKARSTSLVQVQAVKKPEVESALAPLTVNDGETGHLKAKINGEPKPTIRWLKDGKEIKSCNRVESVEEPDGTVSLVIKNARLEDAGNYSLVAQNVKGEVKSSAPLTVNQAPTFQKPLGPVSVVEGFPAKLEAKLSGSPLPEISWLKDGKPIIPDGKHIREIKNPDGTVALLLDACQLEDAGRFSLVAKNALGEDTSSGNLDVRGKEAYGAPKSAPCVLTPLGNLCVKEGEPIRFETEVTGNPLPDISWTVNDKDLQPSDNTLMTFDGKKAILEIKRSSPEHIGVYKCALTNSLGNADTEGSVAVQEKSAPHFIQRLTDFNGFINQPMKLQCKLTGYPEPEIDWYFNGNLLGLNSPRYNFANFGDTYTLTIPGAQPQDSGVYECKASNSVGEDHTRAAVNISDKVEKGEPPMFLKKIGDKEVMEGMTAKFTACVTGIPTPDVSWVKEGNPLEPSPRHKMELESTGILRLIIREVESSDYGNYSVTISNVHGSATSSAKLCPDNLDDKYITPIGDQFVDFDKFRKTGAPVPLPEKPRIIRMDDRSLTLGWKPSVPNAPRLPVTYQLEMATHPDGEWTPYKIGLKDTLCDVRDLKPGSDYKFRIRVENKHGVSEPSPYTTAHRSKIYEPPKPQDFKPKDYEIEHPPLQKYAAAPRFLRKEEDSMYGVKGQPVTIEFWVYGHPEPQVTWFKGESQIGKDKYSFMQDRNGKLCVFIDCMSDDYVGTYTCVAVNDEGEASMKIKLLLAETPIFIQRLDETTSMSRRTGRMQCRVTGLPYPKVKWYRDWHPLYESERVKILWEEPDKCTLFISNLITRDNALYSCTATNIAGTATSSAILNVEDSEETFDAKSYCRPIPVRARTKPFEDVYDIGDELGRGTQGITYHAVKRDTGDSYAAKSMHGKGKLKDFMKSEMEIMNQMCHPKLVRLRDAFETQDSLTLVTDICGGGELLGNIIKRGGASEREIAEYIKQVLEGLEYMHTRYIGHLGLTIGDVLVARVNSYDIKCGDFGVSARLLPGKEYFLEYGHPEFVAPEIANKQPASLLSDMWSVGVITYLLLSGISPFLGEHDRETLTRVQQGKINFVEDAFIGVSDDAKDFMSKLLVFDAKSRMDVKTALNHRWFKYYADKPLDSGIKLSNLDRLKEYQNKWKKWYDNASCKRYYRRRTLESCFHHPSKMIYPPGESYTPEGTPEQDLDRSRIKPSQFDDITFKQKINREEIDFRSESSYQNGPDTYLLQLRDTDFPLRLRQYLRVGARSSAALAANLRDTHWGDSTLVIRERRKFVDIMDEEIDDEKKGYISTSIPRRIYHEVGTLGFAHEQMEHLKKEVWKDRGSRDTEIGMAPYFREKIRNLSMKEGEEIVFRCYAIGTPKADYSWFRNDGILLESSRIVVKELKDGHCELRINPTRAYDAGVYKCVARNMHGTACCRARLRLGSKPGRPEAPVMKDASDTEIYITWAVPRDEGQSTTLGYTLEYKKADVEEWTVICNNIEHEYFVIRNLLPSTFYQFRVKAYNKFGWGEPGFPTDPLSTKAEGAPKVKVSPRRKYQQEFTERTPEFELTEIELQELDYSRETNPIPLVEGETLDLYRIVSEMDRGRFSVILNVWVKETNTSSVAKVIQTTDYADGKNEYEIIKSLCHEKIVMFFSASFKADKTVLVMEKLSGVDVMSFLALRHDYNEELVVTIIKQVLEALQYLHFREICYLELQPDNVVMVNLRDSDIKLVDFGSARYIPKSGAKISLKGCPEYLAPEILKNEEVSSLTDVWCVGVLTYILLSGTSPFLGKDEEETRANVTYVRYHFDNMHPDVTSEVTRFLLNIFKQCPIKRLTLDECLEHKWLASSEYMIMKRESARFLPDKLADFARKFHTQRYEAMNPEMLTSLNMSSTKQELIIDL